METPRPSKAVREDRISIDNLHHIDIFMIDGDEEGTYVVFAMEWQSTQEGSGHTASGKIAIGPDTYSSRADADERFSSIMENWSV